MAIRTRTTESEFTIESKLTSIDSCVAMASHLAVRTMNTFDSEIYTSTRSSVRMSDRTARMKSRYSLLSNLYWIWLLICLAFVCSFYFVNVKPSSKNKQFTIDSLCFIYYTFVLISIVNCIRSSCFCSIHCRLIVLRTKGV